MPTIAHVHYKPVAQASDFPSLTMAADSQWDPVYVGQETEEERV